MKWTCHTERLAIIATARLRESEGDSKRHTITIGPGGGSET
jgi:hypothetical protein